MKRILTLKNIMIDYATSESQADLESNWLMFYTLHCLGYITDNTWPKFFNECSHWYYDTDLCAVCTHVKNSLGFYEKITITPDYIETVCK